MLISVKLEYSINSVECTTYSHMPSVLVLSGFEREVCQANSGWCTKNLSVSMFDPSQQALSELLIEDANNSLSQ